MSSPIDKQNSQQQQQQNVYWKDGLQQSQMNFNNLQDQQQIPPQHQQANQFFQNPPNPNVAPRYHSNPTNMQMNVNQQQQPMEQQQNFTVLSDGLGNYFLKVYHNNNENIDFQNPNQTYELFSNPNNFLFNNVQQQQQQQNFQQPTEAMQPQSFINQEMPTSDDLEEQHPGNNITNMFINQLVGNWAPNATGNYTPFGESSNFRNEMQPNQSFSPASVASQQQDHVTMSQNSPGKMHDSEIFNVNQNKTFLDPANNSFQTSIDSSNNKINSPNVVIKKPRIVAEVKPMRMSYSDVLIKNVVPNKQKQSGGNSPVLVTATNGNNGNGTSNKPAKNNKNGNNSDRKSQGGADDAGIFGGNNKLRKSTGGNGKSTDPASVTPKPLATDNNSSTGSIDSRKKTLKTKPKTENLEKVQTKPTVKRTNSNTPNLAKDSAAKKQSAESSSDEEEEEEEDDDDDDDYYVEDENRSSDIYYNIHKNDSMGKSSAQTAASKYKKPAPAVNSKINTIPTRGGLTKQDKSYNKRNQKSKRNAKHAMLIKLSEKWLEYTLMVLTWLWSLVSDVVYLSFGLIWDKMSVGWNYLAQICQHSYSEFRSNSGLPTAWLRNWWLRMDGRFVNNSKWAFWRRFGKKKTPEPVKDYYKDGRLPSTADEAMCSLLNCKGKDAYSILGVSPDCSQEQIRKHYKKIAVLVHPDKNKQPGAEEAFKVLQRSFELIGEPENRQTYDQSMAEALNAEKAWSEFNDLLTQLHTKISEAANTIRCSSCSLRHPRKPTGRPHYAARECNSCKIRHSAREGDIWAETTFFGLRWKYLALMEGNVYDITEWANCQKGALSHLQPNSHIVQYRIVLGGHTNSNQQQQQQQQQSNQQPEKEKFKKDPAAAGSTCEPDLDDFLNNIYGGQTQQQNARRRHKKN